MPVDPFAAFYTGLGSAGGNAPGGASSSFAEAMSAIGGAANPGGLGGAGFNPQKQQSDAANLQNKAFSQQIKQRQQILDMLLGNFGKSSSASGTSGGVGGLLDQLEGAGQGTRNVINENFQNLQNSTLARFARHGMGGSSGVPSVLSGIERQKALAIGELDDQLINQRIGVQERGMDRAIQLQQLLAGLV